MTKKLLVVFAATGAQGSSIIRTVLSDPELSSQFSIRAITREPSKPAAQVLASLGASVTAVDFSSPTSLASACSGAHTIFSNTISEDHAPISNELTQGKAIADAAVSAGASWLIYSTLSNTKAISSGKYTKIVHFDVKADVEAYIRALPIRSAFFSPGTFMSNFATFMKPRPHWDGSGTYILSGPQSADTMMPLINTEGDTGKFVAAILAEPERFEGKILYGTSGHVSQTEMAAIFRRVTGKQVRYVQIEPEVFARYIPHRGEEVVEMMLYFQDFGYWGEGTEEGVEWSLKQARGKLTGFEEYVSTVNPVQLE